jgi:hypothetical protein
MSTPSIWHHTLLATTDAGEVGEEDRERVLLVKMPWRAKLTIGSRIRIEEGNRG